MKKNNFTKIFFILALMNPMVMMPMEPLDAADNAVVGQECSVCFEVQNPHQFRKLPNCKHLLCMTCIDAFSAAGRKECPECRALWTEQELARSLEEQAKPKKQDCPICFESRAVDEFPKLSCGHDTICVHCIKEELDPVLDAAELQIQMRDNLVCLNEGCRKAAKKEILTPTDIHFIYAGDQSRFERFLEVVRLLELKQKNVQNDAAFNKLVADDPELKNCPAQNCECKHYIDEDEDPENIQCPVCNHEFCSHCIGIHRQGAPCVQAPDPLQNNNNEVNRELSPEELANRAWAREHIKACPSCKKNIQRVDGCNYIRCECGHEFCWMCLVPDPGHNHVRCLPEDLERAERIYGKGGGVASRAGDIYGLDYRPAPVPAIAPAPVPVVVQRAPNNNRIDAAIDDLFAAQNGVAQNNRVFDLGGDRRVPNNRVLDINDFRQRIAEQGAAAQRQREAERRQLQADYARRVERQEEQMVQRYYERLEREAAAQRQLAQEAEQRRLHNQAEFERLQREAEERQRQQQEGFRRILQQQEQIQRPVVQRPIYDANGIRINIEAPQGDWGNNYNYRLNVNVPAVQAEEIPYNDPYIIAAPAAAPAPEPAEQPVSPEAPCNNSFIKNSSFKVIRAFAIVGIGFLVYKAYEYFTSPKAEIPPQDLKVSLDALMKEVIRNKRLAENGTYVRDTLKNFIAQEEKKNAYGNLNETQLIQLQVLIDLIDESYSAGNSEAYYAQLVKFVMEVQKGKNSSSEAQQDAVTAPEVAKPVQMKKVAPGRTKKRTKNVRAKKR